MRVRSAAQFRAPLCLKPEKINKLIAVIHLPFPGFVIHQDLIILCIPLSPEKFTQGSHTASLNYPESNETLTTFLIKHFRARDPLIKRSTIEKSAAHQVSTRLRAMFAACGLPSSNEKCKEEIGIHIRDKNFYSVCTSPYLSMELPRANSLNTTTLWLWHLSR